MTVNFKVKTQALAYREGFIDAMDLLVTLLEEGGINNLLEGIENNSTPEIKNRLNKYYDQKNAQYKA